VSGMTVPDYVLSRDDQEYERLRTQARMWEPHTGRLLDRIGLARGSRCLDAGCGPGETMRADGHRQCMFQPFDVAAGDPIPGAPFDLVFARLLLIHADDPADVLRRLWDAVAPGGHLVVQEYDARTARVDPELATVDEFTRMAIDTFDRAGRDTCLGLRLPALFDEAAIGVPDGMDAAALVAPLRELAPMYEAVYRSLLPAALELGVTTEDRSRAWFDAFARESADAATHAALWALLIGAWKEKA